MLDLDFIFNFSSSIAAEESAALVAQYNSLHLYSGNKKFRIIGKVSDDNWSTLLDLFNAIVEAHGDNVNIEGRILGLDNSGFPSYKAEYRKESRAFIHADLEWLRDYTPEQIRELHSAALKKYRNQKEGII